MYIAGVNVLNGVAVADRDEPETDNFAECPDWARAELDRRIESLDRDKGLTTQQVAQSMRAWREERRRIREAAQQRETKGPGF
ncbi:hypothetical protein [Azospirillum sp. sgz301742]